MPSDSRNGCYGSMVIAAEGWKIGPAEWDVWEGGESGSGRDCLSGEL